jgi:phospholipid/cholesterol/gamma-HCH transport system substrate-binding protein
MEPEAKYTLVGTVVLILLALITASVVWLKSTGGQRDEEPYKIYFVRQSLEGLQIRSDVKMRGIRIGAVTGFRISSQRPGSVEVVVRVAGSAPVLQSTRAIVDRHLLTGIASIRLVNEDENSPPLKAVQPGEPYPVIAEGESEYQQFSESMVQMAQRADETLKRINVVLSDDNQAALKDILANLRRISTHVDRSLANLDRTLVSMGGAADEVRKLSAGVGADTRRLAERYDRLGAESTTAVREISESVRRVSDDVARLSTRADALFADGGAELRATARELRSAADSLGTAARRLGDPGKVLFGPPAGSLGPGEAAK